MICCLWTVCCKSCKCWNLYSFYYLYIKIDYILSHFYHQLHPSFSSISWQSMQCIMEKKYEAKKIKVIYIYFSLSFLYEKLILCKLTGKQWTCIGKRLYCVLKHTHWKCTDIYYPCFSLNSDDILTDFNKGIILVSGNMTISKINLTVTRLRLA